MLGTTWGCWNAERCPGAGAQDCWLRSTRTTRNCRSFDPCWLFETHTVYKAVGRMPVLAACVQDHQARVCVRQWTREALSSVVVMSLACAPVASDIPGALPLETSPSTDSSSHLQNLLFSTSWLCGKEVP